jgi:hypothetical protein
MDGKEGKERINLGYKYFPGLLYTSNVIRHDYDHIEWRLVEIDGAVLCCDWSTRI